MFRLLSTVLALTFLLDVESSCRKRTVVVPAAPLTPPASEPAAPATESSGVGQPAPISRPAPPVQSQSPPQPPSQQQTAPPRRTAQPAAPSVQPRLGEIFTADQEREYNTAIDQSLGRTQKNLSSIANRALTKEQTAVVAQIQSFARDAQTMRKSDLAAARRLAERADLLARDLAASLH
jgi:hypothetical protein